MERVATVNVRLGSQPYDGSYDPSSPPRRVWTRNPDTQHSPRSPDPSAPPRSHPRLAVFLVHRLPRKPLLLVRGAN